MSTNIVPVGCEISKEKVGHVKLMMVVGIVSILFSGTSLHEDMSPLKHLTATSLKLLHDLDSNGRRRPASTSLTKTA